MGRRSLPGKLGKGVFFAQVDSVDSQDSVDVMAVCWLRISGADVSKRRPKVGHPITGKDNPLSNHYMFFPK